MDEPARFHVNKEGGCVTCIMKGKLLIPRSTSFIPLSEIGMSKCNPADIFDENIGKKLAYARAENLLYRAAINIHRDILKTETKRINEFKAKADQCIATNKAFINKLYTQSESWGPEVF
jgi:hypothetical protein